MPLEKRKKMIGSPPIRNEGLTIITKKRARRRVIGGQRQAIEGLPIGKTAC
jgi:hypothetical protein